MKLLLVILVTVIVGCLQDVDTEYVSTNGYAHSDTLTMETICYEGEVDEWGSVSYYWTPGYNVLSYQVWFNSSSYNTFENKVFEIDLGIKFICNNSFNSYEHYIISY